MIVDSSARVAILRAEPEAPACAAALARQRPSRISAVNYVEAAVVVESQEDPLARRSFDHLLRRAEILVAPVTVELVEIARAAYRDFGKGSGHPARLNLGDCFAYALAKASGEPLLYQGSDFAHTDIPAVPIQS